MNPKQADQRNSTRLRGFAAAHHLRVRTFTIDGEELDAVKGRVICFGVRAAVSELADVPRLLGVIDEWSAKPGWIEDGQKRLCFSIWPRHVDYLNRTIGFDTYHYTPFNSRTLLPPESTMWGEILCSLGIRYLTESENGIAFTFPTEDEVAVRTVLALAAAKVTLKDFDQISGAIRSVCAASGGGLLSKLALASIHLRSWSQSTNPSTIGFQRLR